MKIILLNYADDRFNHKGGLFRQSQKAQSASALKHGVDWVNEWDWEALRSTAFYYDRAAYLRRPYNLNGQVFKPYLILRTLNEMNQGDVLIYYDSGTGEHVFDTSVKPLVDLCIANKGTVIAHWGDSNAKWTKRDAFHYMWLDDSGCHRAPHMQATWVVFEKTGFTVDLAREWLHFTLDERVASYENDRVAGLPDLPAFVEHRGDQSVLSLLAYKYRLRTFPGVGGPANRVIGNFIRGLN